jgi:hypothetical protein
MFKFIRDLFGWQRNNYDKVGHFAQGFVPAIIAREVLIRRSAVNGRAWLNLFVISICLAFSALYEIFGVDCRSRERRLGRRFSRHARLCLGHTVRHGHGFGGRDSRRCSSK